MADWLIFALVQVGYSVVKAIANALKTWIDKKSLEEQGKGDGKIG